MMTKLIAPASAAHTHPSACRLASWILNGVNIPVSDEQRDIKEAMNFHCISKLLDRFVNN